MDIRTLKRSSRVSVACGLILAAGLVLACSDPPTSTGTTPTYPVGGLVTGLVGSGLVLRDNGGDDLAVSANGSVTFVTPVASGAAYDVTVFAQPTNPAQTCIVTGGSGTMSGANVTTVGIVCTTNTYTVGGTVSDLAGSSLVLRDNGGDDLAVSANGSFTFATPLASGAAYSVTVLTQPTNPTQTCVVTGGSGTVSAANVISVAIACATSSYTVGGTVSGLTGSGLVLRNNGGDDFAVTGNGTFTFATPVSNGAAFDVTVFTQPASPAQTCTVAGGSGTVVTANITNVAIVCSTSAYTVGGTVSGLVGSGLVLRNNGGDDLAVTANGLFTFATPVAKGATYSVTVFTQPANPAQTCVVANGSGTLATANVTNVAIACTTNTYTVGGTVTGLVGSGLVLRNNGGDDLSVSANGSVTFAQPVTAGSDYNVTVLTQPSSPAQTCVVAGGGGTVTHANITTVMIACTNGINGILRVTVATTGAGAPATYLIAVDYGSSGYYPPDVPSNGTVPFALAPGAHTVQLVVPQNCTVTSPNNVSVTVTAGATTDIALSVTCVANGTVRVTVATTGPDAPATDGVLDLGPSGYYDAVVPSNGTVSFARVPGAHTVSLTVAQNCTVTTPNPVTVTVPPGATTDIAFSVTCVANGTVQVTVVTTGPDAPATYEVAMDAGSGGYYSVPSNGSVTVALALGTASVELWAIQNCTVTSPNPVSVTVAAGAPTNIAFSVTCVANGTLQVTVATTGPNAPATYTVHGEVGSVVYPSNVPSNGTGSFALASGAHTVSLVVAPNCTVTTPNPVTVTVPPGATTDIAFSVTCVAITTATIHVTVLTLGTNGPATYEVTAVRLPPNQYSYAASTQHGTVSLPVSPGWYLVRLGVPMNCTYNPHSPQLTVGSGATASIAFTVVCQ